MKKIWMVFTYMLAWWGLFNIFAFIWLLMDYRDMARPMTHIPSADRHEPPPLPVPVDNELAPWLDLDKQFEL